MEVKDLVEDWIAIRATLARQLTALKSGQVPTDDAISDGTLQTTIERLEIWMRDLNALLKSYASAKRT